jgi:hypothetical protein
MRRVPDRAASARRGEVPGYDYHGREQPIQWESDLLMTIKNGLEIVGIGLSDG